ncbi:5-oxoprolinase subunit B family protein [Nakamurella sp.]|uniref:5-oxoprolinase subunit B family protein n=1 Tax=Nakamurella sp. TaxID=1869182 RepID=UPI003B3B8E8D
MTPRLRRAGDRALLLETGDPAGTLAVAAALAAADLHEVDDLVLAAATVLIRVARGTDLTALGRRVLAVTGSATTGSARADDATTGGATTGGPPAGSGVTAPDDLEIAVVYDGPDLAEVAASTGLTVAEVIATHTGTPWQAAFVGFAPGFAYLIGGDPRLRVARHPQSRPRVPAGSVALAGEYSAVYPRESPGGWQLIGHTTARLWDETAEPPAAIRPGRRVRFRVAGARP